MWDRFCLYNQGMSAASTLLCIHRNPSQLNLLKEQGYQLLIATNGHDGLRLFMSRTVDAIVLEYHLGLLDGAVVAAEIKQVRPKIPIVMLADHSELPKGVLNSVDVVVAKSDGPHFLWAAVHFMLNVKPEQRLDGKANVRTRQGPRLAETRMRRRARRSEALALARDDEKSPFSAELWKSILKGTVHF